MKKQKAPVASEYQEAVAFHQWLQGQRIDHFHVPNETGGHGARGAMNKRMGVSAGVPDFFVFIRKGSEVRRIVIELKRKDGGTGATPAQRDWLRKLAGYGFEAYICDGAFEAIEVVQGKQKNLIDEKFSTDLTEVDSPF